VPAHAPPHPVKYEFVSALDRRVTLRGVDPFEYFIVQSGPQLIPSGELVIVPPPVPALETMSNDDCALET
jgi:hypothetical protein